MSRTPQALSPVPAETARRARAASPKGSVSMHRRDGVGSISSEEDGADVFPKDGQPAEAPWRLALVTGMPGVENLSDQQAADAVRGRRDWKDLLGLERTDPGCDASVLSACRARLIARHAQERVLENRLPRVQQNGWLNARGRQRTDSTPVLAKTRALNRGRGVWETMRSALKRLAVAAPDWLRAHRHLEWVERSGPRREDSRAPLGEAERLACAEEIGHQGSKLLDAVCDPTAPAWLRALPAVDILRHVWVQHSHWGDAVGRWRSSEHLPPPSRSIGSPSDDEAHSSTKRRTPWVGDTVQLTESGEAQLPLLMTHVDTTSAPVSDEAMTAPMHAERDRTARVPGEQVVETGAVDATLLVESQREEHRDLGGPTRKTSRWQASQQTGSDADHVLMDWEKQQAACPEGHVRSRWTPAMDTRTTEGIKSTVSTTDCQACPVRSLGTPSRRHIRRTVTSRPQDHSLALKQRREQEQTTEWTQVSATRAGSEGTISQGVRTMGLRRSRSLGQEHTHLHQGAPAAALYLVRSMAWCDGLPRAQTRRSACARLSDAA
jgi:transposase